MVTPTRAVEKIYDNTYGAQRTRVTHNIENNGQFQACIFDVEDMEWMIPDTDHQEPLRFVWVNPDALTPSFTGQIPGARKNKKN